MVVERGQGSVTVSVDETEVADFCDMWPACNLRGLEGVTFTFDARDGALVDVDYVNGDSDEWDGPALLALSHDAEDQAGLAAAGGRFSPNARDVRGRMGAATAMVRPGHDPDHDDESWTSRQLHWVRSPGSETIIGQAEVQTHRSDGSHRGYARGGSLHAPIGPVAWSSPPGATWEKAAQEALRLAGARIEAPSSDATLTENGARARERFSEGFAAGSRDREHHRARPLCSTRGSRDAAPGSLSPVVKSDDHAYYHGYKAGTEGAASDPGAFLQYQSKHRRSAGSGARAMVANATPKIEVLGDVLGPLTYMGSCPRCGRQHMSTHDRVIRIGHQNYCVPCGEKELAMKTHSRNPAHLELDGKFAFGIGTKEHRANARRRAAGGRHAPEADPMKDPEVTFFYEHAGYSYPRGATPAQQRKARVQGAQALAAAEAQAAERNWTVEWEYDTDADTSWMDEEQLADAAAGRLESLLALLKDERGEVLDSLGGIVVRAPAFIRGAPQDPQLRVIAAELALGALNNERDVNRAMALNGRGAGTDERRARSWMEMHANEFEDRKTGEVNFTELAETAANHVGHNEWLDDPNHPIWDWAVEAGEGHSLAVLGYVGNASAEVIATLRSGKPVYAPDSGSYTVHFKLPKWNIEPTVLQAAGQSTIPRGIIEQLFPGWTKADHAEAAEVMAKARDAANAEWQKDAASAGKKYGSHGGAVSGAHREHFPEHVKEVLRHLAHYATAAGKASHFHYIATGARNPYFTTPLHPDRRS